MTRSSLTLSMKRMIGSWLSAGASLATRGRCAAVIALVMAAALPAVRAEQAPALSHGDATSRVRSTPATVAERYPAWSRYGVWRNGDRIGEHRLRFGHDDGVLLVDIESTIRVTVLGIPVFRFTYAAQERWDADGLHAVDVRISENGDSWRTSLRTDGASTLLTGPDGETTAASVDFASNHWHRGVLQVDRVFNTLTGSVSEVDVEPVGRDTLIASTADGATGGVAIDYTRYRYSGDIDVESWYDDAGRWVGLAFNGEDGSRIEYRLEP